MLHALLHRKLHPATPEPQRLEDALTSTLFGGLLSLRRWDLLSAWLQVRAGQQSATDVSKNAYWFWPRLAFAEPDVVIRLGKTLVIVEAKLRSGRHDTAQGEDGEEALSDQVIRQYKSVVTPRSKRLAYDAALESAIADCTLEQVMMVDGRRMRRARRELGESLSRLPKGATLRLVTWQALHSRLTATGDLRVAELRAYMELIGLDAFDGFGRRLKSRDAVIALSQWRGPQQRSRGLRAAFAESNPHRILRILEWRADPACPTSHAPENPNRDHLHTLIP